MRRIEWRYMPAAEGWDDYEPDIALWLNVAKVDAEWRRTDQHIVPGGANGQDRRYFRAGEWFAKNPFSNMLVICFDPNGGIRFTDGRHRFSWLRDHGASAAQFQVSPADADRFRTSLGADLRETIVTLPG